MAETNIAQFVANPLATRKGQRPINPLLKEKFELALEKKAS